MTVRVDDAGRAVQQGPQVQIGGNERYAKQGVFERYHRTPAALRKLVETGLWRAAGDDAARRAEGFNRITLAA